MNKGYRERKEICTLAKKLSTQDMIDVGQILVHAGYKDLIKEGPDGCRINLDKIDNVATIEQVLKTIKYKTDKPK